MPVAEMLEHSTYSGDLADLRNEDEPLTVALNGQTITFADAHIAPHARRDHDATLPTDHDCLHHRPICHKADCGR